ncbi:hypothetical protein [Planctomicrobium sp. SH664]
MSRGRTVRLLAEEGAIKTIPREVVLWPMGLPSNRMNLLPVVTDSPCHD